MRANCLTSYFRLIVNVHELAITTNADIQNVLKPDATHDHLEVWIYQSLKCRMDMDKNV